MKHARQWFAVLAFVAALAPSWAEETYAPNAFRIDRAVSDEEIWKVKSTIEQDVAGQITQRIWIDENWKVTPGTTESGDGFSLAVTLAGVGFEMKTPQGDESRSYGDAELANILDKNGNKIPFERTWTFSVGSDLSFREGPEGTTGTIAQLLEYAAYRARKDGLVPAWVDLIPEEIREAVGGAIRQFAIEALSRISVDVTRESWNAFTQPFRTVIDQLHMAPMEARTPPSIQPEAEFDMTGPDGASAGRIRYLGTTKEGEIAHFAILPIAGLDLESTGAPVAQEATFAIDRAGRPVSLSFEQNVGGPDLGPAIGGSVRQSFRIEWTQAEKQG